MDLFFNKDEQRLRSGWRLLIQFILMFFIAGFAALGLQTFWQSSLSIASAIPQCIGALASIWLAAHLLDRRSITEYGLSFNRRWWIDFGAGTLIAGIAIGTIFVLQWLFGWLTITGFGWESTSTISFIGALLSSFFAMLLVGFYEELFSRGYQILNLTEGLRYPKIGKRGAVAMAVLGTSILFGLLHFYNPNASLVSTFNIVLAGVILAAPYIWTGELGISAGLHFSWNFVQGSIFGYPVSGTHLDATLIRVAQNGSRVWTGGGFGPEASILGILGMAIMLGGSYVYITTSGYECSIAELFTKEYRSVIKSDEQAL